MSPFTPKAVLLLLYEFLIHLTSHKQCLFTCDSFYLAGVRDMSGFVFAPQIEYPFLGLVFV